MSNAVHPTDTSYEAGQRFIRDWYDPAYGGFRGEEPCGPSRLSRRIHAEANEHADADAFIDGAWAALDRMCPMHADDGRFREGQET